MAAWRLARRWFGRNRKSASPSEADVPGDPATAETRATGGTPDPGAENPNSTTGTTASGTFVGRASGDEAGDAGLSGAEGRARQQRRDTDA